MMIRLLLLWLAVSGCAQGIAQDPFAPVPDNLRTHFIERLNVVVELHQKQEWDKLYDLLYQHDGLSKQQYVRREHKYQRPKTDGLVRFAPQGVTFIEHDSSWAVYGCGEWRSHGQIERRTTTVYAKLQNGEWYFSRLAVAILDEPDACSKAVPNIGLHWSARACLVGNT